MVENKSFTIQKKNFSVSQNSITEKKNFVITKKIAKHGKQNIIIIPTLLQEQLPYGSLVEVKIEVIKE